MASPSRRSFCFDPAVMHSIESYQSCESAPPLGGASPFITPHHLLMMGRTISALSRMLNVSEYPQKLHVMRTRSSLGMLFRLPIAFDLLFNLSQFSIRPIAAVSLSHSYRCAWRDDRRKSYLIFHVTHSSA